MKKDILKQMPLFLKLYIFIVITLLIPLSVVTFNNNDKLRQYAEVEIINSAVTSLKSSEELMNMVFGNIVTTAINFSKDPLISEVSELKKLDKLKTSSSNVEIIRKIANKLKVIEYSDPVYYSIYFYLKDADYIISTKTDTSGIDGFRDLDWMKTAAVSSQNVWVPRLIPFEALSSNDDRGFTNAVSFLYHTTNFTTSAKALLVVNLNEKKLCDIMNNNEFDKNSSTFIVDTKGIMVSHLDKSQLIKDMSNQPYIQKIINADTEEGYIIDESSGQRILYCYNYSNLNDWIYVSQHSLDLLLDRSKELRTQALILTFGISLLFFIIAYLFSRRVTNPIQKLIKSIVTRYKMDKKYNEIDFLVKAFNEIEEQKEYLNTLVKKNEVSMKEIFLLDLLKGKINQESDDYQGIKKDDLFPYGLFMVALIHVDNQQAFDNLYTPDQRLFLRMLIQKKCGELAHENMIFHTVLYEEEKLCTIINLKSYDCIETNEVLKNIFAELQGSINKDLGNSISIGLSGCHSNLSSMQEALSEAIDAVRRKLLHGHSSLIFWTPGITARHKYFYPFSREKHILNNLGTGHPDKVEQEVHELVQEIRGMNDISCENILQIFNQLISATIKHLAENNIAIGRIFPNIYNIYRDVAGRETLEDLEDYMISFFRKAQLPPQSEPGKTMSMDERILHYLNTRYKTEIRFDQMADDLQISYSYIRKIVKDITGKSILDYINSLRINEGKRLLTQTNMSVSEIAQNLGYSNVQSFNRFFRKFEGIAPRDYRARAE